MIPLDVELDDMSVSKPRASGDDPALIEEAERNCM